MGSKIVAAELLHEAVTRHQMHLSVLVAETGLWAHPEVHRRLVSETGAAAMFPYVRRSRPGQGESPGDIVDGIRLDSNNYANVAIKRTVGLTGGLADGFESCHIWPLTCYDPRYHTAVANLVLLPRAIAGLSDHDSEIQQALQYRAYELYGWHPEDRPTPEKPAFYPAIWRDPQPDPEAGPSQGRRRQRLGTDASSALTPDEERCLLESRVRSWAAKPNLKVHKMIALVAESAAGIPRDELARRVALATGSKNANSAVANMLTTNGNAYGAVFQDVGGVIYLNPMVADVVQAMTWTTGRTPGGGADVFDHE